MRNKVNATFRENDIRPDILKKRQSECFAADIRRLLKFKNKFVAVACPACGSEKNRKAFRKYTLDYVRCLECQTIYINPRPTADILNKYYTTSETYAYWNKYIFPASESMRRKHIFRPRVKLVAELCNRYVPGARSLLEVGAGFGTFCEEIRKFNLFKRIVAVESTPDLAQTCRRKGIEVIENQFEKIEFKGERFDVVVSFETIEHLFSPVKFVRKCRKILKNNGFLIVTCPNAKGFDISVLQSISNSVDTEHLNYFNPLSLSRLFTSCGFEVIEVQTPGKLDAELVRKKALNKEFDLSSQPFLQQILLEEWERVGVDFQDFLARNKLSSHMWLMGCKRKT